MNDLVVQQTHLPVTAVIDRLATIQELMKAAMTPGLDYGTIPGTGSKPTLLKPGAEKLCVMFKLCPRYETVKKFDGGHLIVDSICTITDLSGNVLGQASAICTTHESKYAWRKAERVCPSCGKAAIIKGKEEYGGGWLCWAKKGGCNAKFPTGDQSIESQPQGRVANEDLADSYNTVVRIAEKRAWIAAVRLVTGASALFDEESPDYFETPEPAAPKAAEPTKAEPGGITPAQWKEICPNETVGKMVLYRFNAAKPREIRTDQYEEAKLYSRLVREIGPSANLAEQVCSFAKVQFLDKIPADQLRAALDFVANPHSF